MRRTSWLGSRHQGCHVDRTPLLRAPCRSAGQLACRPEEYVEIVGLMLHCGLRSALVAVEGGAAAVSNGTRLQRCVVTL